VLDVVAFTAEHAEIAIDAYARFGKGRHPAALNFGDCMSYAVANLSRQPRLAVGDDFPQTDMAYPANGLVGQWR
jgi:ribonuclease VapC